MDRRHFLGRFAGAAGVPHDNDHGDWPRTFSTTPSLAPYRGEWNATTASHLLRRALLWPTVAEVRAAAAAPVADIVAMLTAEASDLPDPSPYVAAWMRAPDLFFNGERVDMVRTFVEEMQRWWTLLMIEGRMSIRERMVLFWHNHFAGQGFDDVRHLYLQNQLFRRNALGDFRALVGAVTTDKAMLQFLNGRQNKRGAINENYAREMLELFTLGAADNDGIATYTQSDVAAAARVLSGYDWSGDGIGGTVNCDDSTGHDPSSKIFFDTTIPGNVSGNVELDALLDLVFSHREAARFIIRKLYRFFVYTTAPLTPLTPVPAEIEQGIIAPLAEEFRDSQWDIGVVLRRLLASEHFYDPAIIASNVRSPIDLLVGTARAMQADATLLDQRLFTAQEIHLDAGTLGQQIFVPPGVQGWAAYRSWISTSLLPLRHRDTDRLIDGIGSFYLEISGDLYNEPVYIPGHSGVDVLAYTRQWKSFVDDPGTLADDIAGHLLAYPASARLHGQLLDALMQGQPDYEWRNFSDEQKLLRLRSMLKLLMRSPNYQLM